MNFYSMCDVIGNVWLVCVSFSCSGTFDVFVARGNEEPKLVSVCVCVCVCVCMCVCFNLFLFLF